MKQGEDMLELVEGVSHDWLKVPVLDRGSLRVLFWRSFEESLLISTGQIDREFSCLEMIREGIAGSHFVVVVILPSFLADRLFLE